MPERLSRDQVSGLSEEDVTRYIESDYKIRQGLCPNGCGLMQPCDYGQECPTCAFSTNAMPERFEPCERCIGTGKNLMHGHQCDVCGGSGKRTH